MLLMILVTLKCSPWRMGARGDVILTKTSISLWEVRGLSRRWSHSRNLRILPSYSNQKERISVVVREFAIQVDLKLTFIQNLFPNPIACILWSELLNSSLHRSIIVPPGLLRQNKVSQKMVPERFYQVSTCRHVDHVWIFIPFGANRFRRVRL